MFSVASIMKGKGTVTKVDPFDPDAAAFFAAAGITDATQKSATNQFFLTAKNGATPFWSELEDFWPFVGGSATPHSFGAKTLAQGTFNGTVTHNTNGITGDGSTGWFDTDLSNTLDPDSIAFGAYSRTNSDGLYVDMGASDIGGIEYISRLSGSAYFDMTYPAEASAASTDSRGLFSISRAAAGTLKGYRNGSELATVAAASSAMPAVNFAVLSGVASTSYRLSPRNIAFAFASSGLSADQHAALYSAVQAFQTTLGRQV